MPAKAWLITALAVPGRSTSNNSCRVPGTPLTKRVCHTVRWPGLPARQLQSMRLLWVLGSPGLLVVKPAPPANCRALAVSLKELARIAQPPTESLRLSSKVSRVLLPVPTPSLKVIIEKTLTPGLGLMVSPCGSMKKVPLSVRSLSKPASGPTRT